MASSLFPVSTTGVGGLKRSRHHFGSRHCSIVSVHAMTDFPKKLYARSLKLWWCSNGGRISQDHCNSIRHSHLSPIFGDDGSCEHGRSCAGVNLKLPIKQTDSAAEKRHGHILETERYRAVSRPLKAYEETTEALVVRVPKSKKPRKCPAPVYCCQTST